MRAGSLAPSGLLPLDRCEATFALDETELRTQMARPDLGNESSALMERDAGRQGAVEEAEEK